MDRFNVNDYKAFLRTAKTPDDVVRFAAKYDVTVDVDKAGRFLDEIKLGQIRIPDENSLTELPELVEVDPSYYVAIGRGAAGVSALMLRSRMDIDKLLHSFADRYEAAGGTQRITLFMLGGAATMMSFEYRSIAADIDFLFDPKDEDLIKQTVYSCSHYGEFSFQATPEISHNIYFGQPDDAHDVELIPCNAFHDTKDKTFPEVLAEGHFLESYGLLDVYIGNRYFLMARKLSAALDSDILDALNEALEARLYGYEDLTLEKIENHVRTFYGDWNTINDRAQQFCTAFFNSNHLLAYSNYFQRMIENNLRRLYNLITGQ